MSTSVLHQRPKKNSKTRREGMWRVGKSQSAYRQSSRCNFQPRTAVGTAVLLSQNDDGIFLNHLQLQAFCYYVILTVATIACR